MVSVLIQAFGDGAPSDNYTKRRLERNKARQFIVVTSNLVKDSNAIVLVAEDLTDEMTVHGAFHKLHSAKSYRDWHNFGISKYESKGDVVIECKCSKCQGNSTYEKKIQQSINDMNEFHEFVSDYKMMMYLHGR